MQRFTVCEACLVLGGFLIFFILTIIPQKLEFYNMQNALVETIIENHSLSFEGVAYDGNWFIQNTGTKTEQLMFVGDVYPYKNRWFPAKSYGPHYIAAAVYFFLRSFGLSFGSHYRWVSSILLASTSLTLASIGGTFAYIITKRNTGSSTKALTVSILCVFGSLLTGGINIRNEETFGYWLFTIVYLLTFLELKNKWWPILLTILLYYSIYSLPITTLLAPLGLYRIYISGGKKHLQSFILTNIFCITTIAVHNYLIFGRLVFSNYSIGEELNPGYRLGRFSFSWSNWAEKIQFYFVNKQTSIFTNYPLILAGLIGVWLSKQSLVTKLVTFGSVLGFAFYITNIGELTGYVGYGSGRYMLGIFPIVYIYISDVLRDFRPLLWLGTAYAAVLSISNGLFYYFSPVRNVFDRSTAPFAHLPYQGNFFTMVAILLVGGLFLLLTYVQFGKGEVKNR